MSGSTVSAERELPLALIVLATATTIVVATEFIVIGLLPVMATDLGVSTAVAGYLVSAFALSASLLGPPLTLALASQPAARILTGTLLLFAVANLAAVLWPSFPVMLAVRIIQGAALPVFISVGAATVSRLSLPERRGRSLALANTGFAIGVVVALPAGVALADNGVWAPPFLALAGLALAAAALVAAVFPRGDDSSAPSMQQSSRLLIEPRFLIHLILSVTIFAAMFAAYTYLAVWLHDIAGLGNRQIALALAGFGLAGLFGNTVAAWLADRALIRATVVSIAALALAAVGLSFTDQPAMRIPLFLVWGATQTALVTLCQIRVTLAGRSMPAFAMAMNISAANLGIALGALAGGWVVARWGVNAIGWGAMGLLPLVVGLIAVVAAAERRP